MPSVSPHRFAIILLALCCLTAPMRADVVINEIVSAASERNLQWDTAGTARIGTGLRWYQQNFKDAAWQSGPGPFGYGTITSGPVYGTNTGTQMQYLTPSLYLRKTFTVSDADAARPDQLQLTLSYNDGFICYVNGVEVARRWAGPARQFHYHDQPAYNPDLNLGATAGFYSESISLGAASTRLVAGANVIAIHALNFSFTNTTFLMSANLVISGSPSVLVVASADTWKYLPGVVEASGNLYDPALLFTGKLNVPWGAQTSFDDSTWGSGPGPIGAGSATGVGTTVPGVIGQTPSIYLRAIFIATAPQVADTKSMLLLADYDDSFVAYINGIEVARANIGALPNTFTPATAVSNATRNNTGGQSTFTIDSPARLLKEGVNILAIQVHNVAISDADLYLKADLKTSAGAALVANTQQWKFFAGLREPVASDDGSTDESPDGPDYSSDWIELYNNGATIVPLDGWRLTNEPSNADKWVFPAGAVIPANGYLVVFCDGKNVDLRGAGGYLHTNFSLDKDGDYLALRDKTGVLVQDFSPAYPRGSSFHSYGRNATGAAVYFDTATPGEANSGTQFASIVADPVFGAAAGFYASAQSVALTCPTPGASIRYTIDGSEPTETTGFTYGAAINAASNLAIRARAFKTGLIPSRTASRSYLINQTAARKSLPAVCLTADSGRSLYRPYGILSVVNNATTNYSNALWIAGSDPAQFNNPNLRGPFIERPGNLQLLYPAGTPGFNIDCGFRCAGSPYSRPRYVFSYLNNADPNSVSPFSSSSTEKPQINAFFRSDLGGKTLSYPVFPGSAVASFDSLRLRSGKNDISNPFVRDELTRRLFIDTGNVGVHGINATLWINGVYKGFYNPVERPRQTFFQNWYHSDKEWDVWVINDAASGDNLMLQELVTYVRNNPQSTLANYQGTMSRLDMANFIDYLLINLYEVMGDWPHNNYIMARERSLTGKWVFTVWDGEGSFGSFPGSGSPTTRTNQFATATANTSVQHLLISSNTAAESLLYTIRTLYTTLRVSPEFKLLFADRIQKHFFNNGALTDAKILARKNALRDEILPLIPAFSDAPFNSWISGTGDITRYTTAGATNAPSRRQVLLNGYVDDTVGGAQVPPQFQAEGLFPATLAPVLSQNGGQVAQNFQLTITNPNAAGTIYFNTNGLDPRVAGGAIQGSAYSAPIPISQTSTVKARIRNINNEWSPLVEFTFAVSQAPSLLITEIMYHPAPGVDADGEHFEFIELKNTGNSAINLAGMNFSGVTYAFPPGAFLAPGAFSVIVSDAARFASRYPGVQAAGVYAGSLDNSGETLALNDLAGALITSVTYSHSAPWPALPDGYGNSLVPINPNGNPLPNNSTSWRASAMIGGSPSADDPVPAPATVVINELLANAVLPQTDTVELFNPTEQGVDVGGWFLSDNASNPKKYRIADGTIVPAKGYLLFGENDFNPAGAGFSFDANGEEVRLSAADAAGKLTGYSHGFSFGASNALVSFGRYINSAGIESFPSQIRQTFGSANAGPITGPVVISELMYQPALNGDEFVELRNISNSSVPLFDLANPLNTWKLTGIAYSFPSGITLEPRQIILVTSLSETAWRGKYGTPAAVRIYGPYPGNLDNNGERVSLQMPGVPYLNTGGQSVTPYITVDSVDYSRLAPWPLSPAGTGPSLERLNLQAYADDPGNWQPSPLAAGTGGNPAQLTYSMWQSYSFSTAQLANPLVSGLSADPDGDGIPNMREFAQGLNPLAADPAGALAVTLANDSGSGPYLTLQYRRSLAATNVTFLVETAALPGDWLPNSSVQLGTPINNGDGTETVTARDTMTSTEPGKRFIRLRVVAE